MRLFFYDAPRHLGLLITLCLIALLFAASAPQAHEGEDHGEPKIVASTSVNPRLTAQSELFEVVGLPSSAHGGALTLYLSEFATNRPVTDAKIEMTRGDATVTLVAKDGLYAAPAPWVLTPGRYELTLSVTAGDQSDLLIGMIEISAAPPAAASHGNIWDHLRPLLSGLPSVPLWAPAGALLAMLMLAALASSSRGWVRRPVLMLAGLAGLSSAALGAIAIADREPDPPKGPSSLAAALGAPETPRRADDGGVFVPKPTQRLLDIQTIEAEAAESAQKTIRLIGQVIPDPNKSGLVQALLAGRIEPPETGFPAIGSRVKAGDVLAYLTPKIETVDRSDIAQTTGDLDRQIALAEAKLSRLERIKNIVAAATISDARIELENLRGRRAAIKPVLGERQSLTAPVDGAIAQANVTSGQVIEAQTLLFQIVDPAHLFVEALAFDPAAAASIETGSKEASATTADGRSATLVFSGRGITLRQQAVPLRFKVTNSSKPLNVGDSVTVLARVSETIVSTPLPRASVVRSGAGQSIVWIHAAPERFEPKVVATEPIDAARVSVTGGLDAGSRVVTQGAELINQVR